MRGLGIYLAAGILVVLAMDFIAPPAGLGLDVFAWPVAGHQVVVQHVDRTNKGDRLPPPTTVGTRPQPKQDPPLLIGCDPAYSPLSVDARTNFPARCVSENFIVRRHLG